MSSRKRVLIIDTGNYSFMAERLARDFDVTYFIGNDEEAFLLPDRDEIATGFPGVTRLTGDDDFWELIDSKPRQIDAIVFFDVGLGGLATHLRNLNPPYPVYSSGGAQILELDKALLNNKVLPKLGLPAEPFEKLKGTEALKNFVRNKKDLYIKLSFHRGVFETLHYVDWSDFEETFVDIESKLGKRRHSQVFLVQKTILCVFEIGEDTAQINGDIVLPCLIGLENKDAAYLGWVVNKLPPLFEHINGKMKPMFKKYGGYAGSYATEFRIQDALYSTDFKGKPFYTDLTAREPSPPGPVRCEVWSTFSQDVFEIAQGKMPKPKPTGRVVAELTLLSDWYGEGDGHWVKVTYPESIAKSIKLKNACRKNGENWVIPNHCGEFLGSAIGIGDSVDEAVGKCTKNAKQVQAKGLHFDVTAFDDLRDKFAKARKFGLVSI
jgi:hypothetical protein